MGKSKVIFTCQACGQQSPKWMGRCPECNRWDTLLEEKVTATSTNRLTASSPQTNQPTPISHITVDIEKRLLTGIGEFDRVLGGGVVSGSLVLIGGDPGIGKSTLMLQALNGIARQGKTTLYVSGEESVRQLAIRGRRLEKSDQNLLVAAEIDLAAINRMVSQTKPAAVVVDSIQTMFNDTLTAAPGTISQVRESALQLMLLAKQTGTPIFLVGHVTKDGAIAGPRVLEHMVDTVLYFEGDRNHIFRVLRAVKNRFGSTNEIGVFEMRDSGLAEISNPSALFLTERPAHAPGSVVTCSMEGTRPILLEIQALVGRSNYGTPRRTVLGLDHNRVALLSAVMEKQAGFDLAGQDLFMNVAGGVKILEPSVDLGIIAAIAASFLNKAVPPDMIILGEVGLTGEIRAVSRIEARLAEAQKMGFTRCVLPKGVAKRVTQSEPALQIETAGRLDAALELIF